MSRKQISQPLSPRDDSYPIYFILIFFIIAIILLLIVFANFPPFTNDQRENLKIPTDFEGLRKVGNILSIYTKEYYFTVMAGYSAVYVVLNTFSIPGSIFLSFLGGALFGLPVGVLLVCTLTTTGATLCYVLSHFIGRNLVKKFFPDKLKMLGDEISKHRRNLMSYILFLRVTPLVPNWFINISSPILGVPFSIFIPGTFFGIIPATFIAVRAGLTLQELHSLDQILDIRILITLFSLGLLSLLPTWKPFQNMLNNVLNSNKKHG